MPTAGHASRAAIADAQFPVSLLAATVVLGLGTVAWTGLSTFQAYRAVDDLAQRHIALVEAAGVIEYLDEVLTMSAWMAAHTGEPQWEARYRGYDPILAETITKARGLAPTALDAAALQATDEANQRLVAIENQVFDLVREGRLTEAQGLIEGGEYASQKAIYAAGNDAMRDSILASASAAVTSARGALVTSALLGAGLVILSVAAFAATYVKVRAWRAAFLRVEEQRLQAIRESSEAREASLRAEKLAVLGQLTAGVAHEVNNPLQYLVTNNHQALAAAEAASLDDRVPEDVRARLARAAKGMRKNEAGLERIRRLVRSLRGLSRSNNGARAPTDLSRAVEDVLAIARDKASRRQVEIVSQLPPLPPVVASSDEIGQVLLNLVLNGIDACAAGGRVTLRARADPDEVAFDVTDTGPGIPPELGERIFAPFFTTKPTGNGLGLSISQRIANDHGGSLTLLSTPGEGATFTLTLPRGGASS